MNFNGLSASLGTIGTALAALMATGQIPSKAMQWAALALGLIHVIQSFTGKAVTGPTPTEQKPTGNGVGPLATLILTAVFLSIAPQANAQTVPAPSNFVAVGAAYNGAAGNGWVSYGKSLGAGFSSFTTYDVTLASRKPLVFQYSARTGVGFDFTTVAPSLSVGGHLHIIGLGDGGTAATSAALGTAFSGGGLASWDFGEKAHHLNIVGGGRLLKTSTGGTGTVIELGIALPF